LRKDIYTLQQLFDACYDDEEMKSLVKQLNAKQLRYNILMEQKGIHVTDYEYRKKIMEKLCK